MKWTHYPSPLGVLTLWSDGTSLVGIYYPGHGPEARKQDRAENDYLLEQAKTELEEYFEGKRQTFSVPWKAEGTAFQERVWGELAAVTWGETVSYGELARRIGSPKAARQVGQAVGANPVSIILGCHRVIGADGSLTGYGGGLQRKIFLLELEKAN